MDMNTDSTTGDVTYHPSREPGWKPEYNALWFEYLNEKGGKGISKDTWHMVSSLQTGHVHHYWYSHSADRPLF